MDNPIKTYYLNVLRLKYLNFITLCCTKDFKTILMFVIKSFCSSVLVLFLFCLHYTSPDWYHATHTTDGFNDYKTHLQYEFILFSLYFLVEKFL